MRVLRRPVDNLVQFGSFSSVAVVLAFVWHDAIAIAIAAGLLTLAVRAARSGLRVDDEGITVRNVFRTYRIPWDHYQRVDLHRAGRPPMPTVVLRRDDGAPVALWCIQPSTRGQRGHEARLRVLREVQGLVRSVHPDAP
ncbi:MAG: Bacterial domain [Acidimicrobiaceae bacterium]|jgi:hypothetical protein|nr:Bacterial domain [Acidimicrobiaceae bacterium]